MSSVNLRAGACFKVTCISVSICSSVGLFFVTPCKTDSKYKNNKYLNNNFSKSINSVRNYPFKLCNQNTKLRCKICSKLTIKTRQRCRGFFGSLSNLAPPWTTNCLVTQPLQFLPETNPSNFYFLSGNRLNIFICLYICKK